MNQGLMIRFGQWWSGLWRTPENQKLLEAEKKMLQMPQVECPLEHRFAPGVYMREITMPAGVMLLGAEHKTKHFNVVLSGKAVVKYDGKQEVLEAPTVFVSEPGVRKVFYVIEEMRFATIHPTKETNVNKLEKQLVKYEAPYLEHKATTRLQEGR